jgi:CheY-specific phosphatase CheX
MELDSLQAKVLAPFIDNAIECLESMAKLHALPDEGRHGDADSFFPHDYAVVVETSGLIDGKILIHYYLDTALAVGKRVYANLLGVESESDDIDENIIEALSEFSNTVVGLATRDLKRKDTLIVFDPPYFLSNGEQMSKLGEGAQEILSVPIHVEGVGKLFFDYIIYKEYKVYMTAENA